MRFLTTIVPAPSGFTPEILSKRSLLLEPVAVLVSDLLELEAALENFSKRMLGIVITPGDSIALVQLSSLTWHVTMQADSLNVAARLVPGWLAAIAAADHANQYARTADRRTERVTRELDMTRLDYNELTSRLRHKVSDLLAAKTELKLLNENLESRVERRTAELASVNNQLSQTLDSLKQAQIELVRAGELAALSKLVAGVAHELNTPIGNALTIATSLSHESRQIKSRQIEERLRRSELKSFLNTTEEVTATLERNLVRAADFIGQFKQLAIDQVNEDRRRFRLKDLVSDVSLAMSPLLRETPYILIQEVDRSIEMDSYPDAISQILTTFVSNALTHAFAGRSQGKMIIRTLDGGDDGLILSFADDGNGIEADIVEHVFKPFFTTKFGQGRSGLGLYIAYNQVRNLLGGHLKFSSEIGLGTCFQLTLPRFAPTQKARLRIADRSAAIAA